MTWIAPWSRYQQWLEPPETQDDDLDSVINGLLCTAEIHALAIRCPACGRPYEIRVRDRQSRIFDRSRQFFRCSHCRFAAAVHVIVDVGCRTD